MLYIELWQKNQFSDQKHQKQKPSLIDNIFVNFFNKKLINGNPIDRIFGHLPNFVVIKNIIDKQAKRKFKIRDMKNFSQDKYLEDLKKLKM